jgi:hypothetical protein
MVVLLFDSALQPKPKGQLYQPHTLANTKFLWIYFSNLITDFISIQRLIEAPKSLFCM